MSTSKIVIFNMKNSTPFTLIFFNILSGLSFNRFIKVPFKFLLREDFLHNWSSIITFTANRTRRHLNYSVFYLKVVYYHQASSLILGVINDTFLTENMLTVYLESLTDPLAIAASMAYNKTFQSQNTRSIYSSY